MTCPSCGSPMAADQRYCLTCGARGAEARLPFLDALRPGEAQLVPHGTYALPAMSYAAPMPPPVGGVWTDRLRANSGLLAGLAVLLLALLVGVAIGAGISDSPQTAAAPATQVIRLEGGGVPAAATAAAPTSTDAAADTSASTSSSSSSKAAKKSKAKAAAAKAPVRATNSAVKNLDKLTGAAAVKAADKLGKTVVVGGKAPKKDNKPAAAGGSFQEIG